MESNPEEFFGEATKWRFMFSANFREVLTEPEKGALHEALKEVRRKEFDTLVVKELLKEEMEGSLTGRLQGTYPISNSTLNMKDTLRIGSTTVTEDDLKQLKASTSTTGLFK
jgi:hypothetical protein